MASSDLRGLGIFVSGLVEFVIEYFTLINFDSLSLIVFGFKENRGVMKEG